MEKYFDFATLWAIFARLSELVHCLKFEKFQTLRIWTCDISFWSSCSGDSEYIIFFEKCWNFAKIWPINFSRNEPKPYPSAKFKYFAEYAMYCLYFLHKILSHMPEVSNELKIFKQSLIPRNIQISRCYRASAHFVKSLSAISSRNFNILQNKLYIRNLQITSFKMMYSMSIF